MRRIAFIIIPFMLVFSFIAQTTFASNQTEKPNKPLSPLSADSLFYVTVGAASMVKKSLRNPDSLKWEDIYSSPDGRKICLIYRAQNGFGGMNKEHVSFVNGKPSTSGKSFNKNCSGNGFVDMKHVEYAL